MISRRAVRLHHRKGERAKSVFRFKLRNEALRPGIEHRALFVAHQHADDAGFERAAVTVLPIARERERQSPKTDRSVRPSTHESQQEGQQRVAPGKRAVQIEEGYPGLWRDAAGRFLRQIFTFKYIKIDGLYRIILTHLPALFASGGCMHAIMTCSLGDDARCAGLRDSLVLIASCFCDKATGAAETIRIQCYMVERWD
jgi:hypothetical protein